MECGVDVDHMRLYCWVQHYAPEMEKRPRWYGKRPSIDRSWRVDETYVTVKGHWTYLYRAIGIVLLFLVSRRYIDTAAYTAPLDKDVAGSDE